MVLRIFLVAVLMLVGACASLPNPAAADPARFERILYRTETSLRQMVQDLADPDTEVDVGMLLAELSATRALATMQAVNLGGGGLFSGANVSRGITLGVCQAGLEKIETLVAYDRQLALEYAQGDFTLSCLAALASVRSLERV